LEESRSCYHDNKGALLDKSINIADKVTQLSLASNVISKYTAFVAIEKRNDSTEGTMKIRKMEMSDFLTTPTIPQPVPVMAQNTRSRSSGRGGRGGSKLKSSQQQSQVTHYAQPQFEQSELSNFLLLNAMPESMNNSYSLENENLSEKRKKKRKSQKPKNVAK
jgi:hypothetical protein